MHSVCIVYQSLRIDRENVLFTVKHDDLKRLCELNLNKKEVLEFVSRLDDNTIFINSKSIRTNHLGSLLLLKSIT